VCGYKSGSFTCFDNGSSPATSTSVADDNAEIYYTDGITALERPY
jgi:hypothetical protein